MPISPRLFILGDHSVFKGQDKHVKSYVQTSIAQSSVYTEDRWCTHPCNPRSNFPWLSCMVLEWYVHRSVHACPCNIRESTRHPAGKALRSGFLIVFNLYLFVIY